MPQGYKYEKSQGRFVKKKTEEAFDYDSINKKSAALLVSFFRWYPDYFLDMIRPITADHNLELLQRIMLRISARYSKAQITGCRGGTKTYVINIGNMHDGYFFPNEKIGYVAPVQKQSANLGSEAYKEIERDYPILTANWKIKNDRDDKFRIYTDYGSECTMYIPRGSNKHKLAVEEMGQESPEPFDMANFKSTISPTLRLKRSVNKVIDKTHINEKRVVITNASSRNNLCYSVYRKDALDLMTSGEKYSGYCLDFTWASVILSHIRDTSYFANLFKELSPAEIQKELCAHYTGSDDNLMVADEDLANCRKIVAMEDFRYDNNAIYVVSQDVSYEDGKNNAKIGRVVVKLTEFNEEHKRDKYKAQVVYVDGFSPQGTVYQQALDLKKCWNKYWLNGAEQTFLCIDFQGGYGRAVGEELMKPTTDGSKSLCCYNHIMLQELEQPFSLPVIYPMKSGGRGTANPEADMIDYAQREFRQGNVELLISNRLEGIEQFKQIHNIKDSIEIDNKIIVPYNKTQELCEQIKNLRVVNGKEMRKSKRIQRDMWSALKYALWIKKLLEDELVKKNYEVKSSWKNKISEFENGQAHITTPSAIRNSDRSRLIGLRRR